ncbi:murein L,D-transpeptidase [Pseudahrensia aquimaris]|uniref:Murein L,D-transpeptidase n=1 Tax=Pseudahrensia aquimaris TaxID=744461 RepID=A0ABW3FD19_9HYPH
MSHRTILRAAIGAVSIAAMTALSAKAGTPEQVSAYLERNTVEWSGRSFPTERLRASYEARAFNPIWTSGSGLSEAGRSLIDEISNSYRDGLDPLEYLGGLRGFNEVSSENDAARLELALSHAFLTLGRDLYSGLTTPSVTDPNIVIKPKTVNAQQWLEGAAENGPKEMLRALRPNHPQYGQLRQMLAGYRALLLRGGWNPIDAGETLKPGMTSPRVSQMRDNLSARGYDALQTDQPDFYDDGLKEALMHFQKRHGLSADGVAGPQTFGALNVSAEERVRQLAINLERWRWLPRQLGRRHILVNQAGFELFMVDGRKTVDRRRVIVGKPFHQSPMFSDKISYSEFNPTWTVPTSIAGRVLLPKVLKNPAYLVENNYKLYRGWGANSAELNPYAVDWSAVSATKFPYRVVQQPGKNNSLGQVKFMFPNKFAVYLHDTPSRNLFSRSSRTFSSGCIRVEKPLDFARKIYEMQGGMDPSKVDSIISSKKRTRVNLKEKLPVHLAYFTAWIDDNGVPLFFDDVYERDRLVGRYLF